METEDYLISGFSLYDIRNIYEKKVIQQMKESVKEFSDFHICRECLSDVYALALSRIPATYSLSEESVIDGCLADKEIEEIVNYAIYQVSQRPNHQK